MAAPVTDPGGCVFLTKSSRGIALIEAALIVPLLLLLILSGIEYARCLRVHQRLNSIVRELAGTAFRECSEEANFDNCVNTRVFSPIRSYYQEILPGAELMVSVYRWETPPNTPPPTVDSYVGDPDLVKEPASGSYPSRINKTVFQAGITGTTPLVITPDSEAELLNNHQALVYAEIFYPYTPIVQPIAGIFSYSGGIFYAVNVF